MPDSPEVESHECSKNNISGGLNVTGRQDESWASRRYKRVVRLGICGIREKKKKSRHFLRRWVDQAG